MAPDPQKYLRMFREEARDHLGRLSRGLLRLERKAGDPELVREILRSAHTLKGSARMVGLTDIADVAHRMEDLLNQVSSGSVQADTGTLDLLLQGVEAIRDLTESGAEGRPPGAKALALLERLRGGPAAPAVPPPPPLASETEETVRVDLRGIEELHRRLGELSAVRARMEEQLDLAHRVGGGSEPLEDLAETVVESGRILDDAQHLAQDLLMMPVGILLDDLELALREVARLRGRPARLLIEGGETRLDKRVMEALKPALLHMLRNAVDHGIEPPEERRARAKPLEATIRCRASVRSDRVVLEVEDDGRGMEPERLREAAVAKGLLGADRAQALSDREALNLIFLPGFSTAPRVTETSGRGVGMDVVKANLEQIRGDVVVQTEAGRFTRFVLSLPSNLLSLRSLLVEVAGATYLIPLTYVGGLDRTGREDLLVEGGARKVRWRGREVPYLELRDLLGVEGEGPGPNPSGRRSFVVVCIHDEAYAVVPDRIRTERDVLVKPLDPFQRSSPFVSGTTLLPRGGPGFVLNVFELFRAARGVRAAPRRPTAASPRRLRILVVEDSPTTRALEQGILAGAGFEADAVASGEEALRCADERSYDLFVVDLDLPGISGFDLLRALRKRPPLRETPAVIVSARGSDEDKRRGIEVGAQAYVVKSDFDQAAFLETVRRLAG